MKKFLILLAILSFGVTAFAFDYVPKNIDSDPFGGKSVNKSVENTVSQTQKAGHAIQSDMREIKTIEEYFKYLPAEVHRHWTPYKAETNYEITVLFVVHRDGTISGTRIVGTNYPAANAAVLRAVKSGAPYQPLPQSYLKDSVKAQIVLEYRAGNN